MKIRWKVQEFHLHFQSWLYHHRLDIQFWWLLFLVWCIEKQIDMYENMLWMNPEIVRLHLSYYLEVSWNDLPEVCHTNYYPGVLFVFSHWNQPPCIVSSACSKNQITNFWCNSKHLMLQHKYQIVQVLNRNFQANVSIDTSQDSPILISGILTQFSGEWEYFCNYVSSALSFLLEDQYGVLYLVLNLLELHSHSI